MSVRRILCGLAAFVAAVVGTAAGMPAASANSGTTTDPAAAAAGWLASRLVGGNHLETAFNGRSFPDQGLTADAVLAFDAAKVGQDAAGRATAWLAIPDQLAAYIGDGKTESYAGAHAKVALVAQAQGLDPESFGGRHLLTELRALQAPSGRFSDASQFGDFSNGITQSLAVLALHRAGGAGVPDAAVDYLAGTQCPDGAFPLEFAQPTCVPDTDTTGFAVQALLAAGRTEPAGHALDWLVSVQRSGGGFGGSGPTATVNANSSALAAQALRAGGRIAAADRAAVYVAAADQAVAYLVARQVGCSGAPPNRGAVAYDATGFKADTATRATAQAVLALAGTGLLEVSATGAAGPAPRLACAAPPPPPPTRIASPPATHSATPAASGSAKGGSVSGGGSLPATGTPIGALTALAVLLLAAGSGLVVLGRPRRPVRRAASR